MISKGLNLEFHFLLLQSCIWSSDNSLCSTIVEHGKSNLGTRGRSLASSWSNHCLPTTVSSKKMLRLCDPESRTLLRVAPEEISSFSMATARFGAMTLHRCYLEFRFR